MWNVHRDPPALFNVDDTVVFDAVPGVVLVAQPAHPEADDVAPESTGPAVVVLTAGPRSTIRTAAAKDTPASEPPALVLHRIPRRPPHRSIGCTDTRNGLGCAGDAPGAVEPTIGLPMQ